MKITLPVFAEYDAFVDTIIRAEELFLGGNVPPSELSKIEKILSSYPDAELMARGTSNYGPRLDAVREQLKKASEEHKTLVISPSINPADYVNLGVNGLYGNPVLISKFEIPDANSKDYEDTHKFALSKGLYVPTPRIFMAYFKHVIDAKNNKIALLDGNGSEIKGRELDDIYGHLTTNHISSYGINGRAGVETWLNARFVPGSGFNDMDLEMVISMNKDGSLET